MRRKGYLRGQESFEAQLVNPAADYERRRITVRVGARATRVDPARRVVELAGGEAVGYDRLLVTTGGRNRSLRAPGADLPGIFQLRTVEECDRIRAAARAGARAVVVGMGFIGSEVSASLRQMGVAVSVVEGHPVPLARVLGPEVGAVLAAIHRDHGVELVLGDWFAEPAPLNVVYPQNRHLSSKIRAFVDWIGELFAEHDGIQLRSTLRKH